MGRAIRPLMPQRDPDVPVRVDAQARLRDRRPQGVATQPLEPFALAGTDHDPGVQVKAANVRVTRAERDRSGLFGWTTVAGHAAAGTRPEREKALDRCRRQAGERRRLIGPPIRHPLSSDVAATPRRFKSRSIRCTTTATTSATS